MESPALTLATADEMTEIGAWMRQGLRTFNEGFLGPHKGLPLAAVAKVGGEFVGGMAGVVILDWLSVEIVYVDEKHRGSGLGHRLLMALEEEGRKLGAKRAFVDTTSFQAEGFYAKYGYVEWGRFRNFAPGVDRIYMRKDTL